MNQRSEFDLLLEKALKRREQQQSSAPKSTEHFVKKPSNPPPVDESKMHFSTMWSPDQPTPFSFSSPRNQAVSKFSRGPKRTSTWKPESLQNFLETLPEPHQLTASQQEAFQFLRTYVPQLTAHFTQTELKRIYRRLAVQYHPDRNANGAACFVKIRTAYQTLAAIFPKL